MLEVNRENLHNFGVGNFFFQQVTEINNHKRKISKLNFLKLKILDYQKSQYLQLTKNLYTAYIKSSYNLIIKKKTLVKS